MEVPFDPVLCRVTSGCELMSVCRRNESRTNRFAQPVEQLIGALLDSDGFSKLIKIEHGCDGVLQ